MKKFLEVLLVAALLLAPSVAGATGDEPSKSPEGFPSILASDSTTTSDTRRVLVDTNTGGMYQFVEYETARIEPNALTLVLGSDGYFSGAICTPSAAGDVTFYDVGTATTTGATKILSFGLPNVASQPFVVTLPASMVLKFDSGLVASTTAAVMCYVIYRNEP